MLKTNSKKILIVLFFYLIVLSGSFIFFSANQAQAAREGTVTPQTKLTLQVPILGYTEATDIAEYIGKVYQASLYIIVPIIIAVIIMGGIMWIIAAGDSAVIGKAKSIIINASVSLGIALFSYVLLSLVGIRTLKSPDVEYIEPLEADFSYVLDNMPSQPKPTSPNQPPQNQQPNQPRSSSSNPSYDAVCAKYKGKKYDETVAQECKALGTTPPPGIDLVSLGGYGRGAQTGERGAVESLKRAAECCKSELGYTITATGWRSAVGQYAAYQNYLHGGNPAALPCCSNHGRGTAFDIRINNAPVSAAQVKQISSCFNRNGLYNWPRETWHWSTTGT